MIVPIVVSSKVCSLQTERAREEEMAKVYLSQVQTVCRSDFFDFIHQVCSQSSQQRSVQGADVLTLKFQKLSFDQKKYSFKLKSIVFPLLSLLAKT